MFGIKHCPSCSARTDLARMERQVRAGWPPRCNRCGLDLLPPPDVPAIAVEPWLQARASPRRRFHRRAHAKALSFVLGGEFGWVRYNPAEDPGADRTRLVHGTYLPWAVEGGPRLDFAWVEIDERVGFDPVFQKFYALGPYRRVLDLEPTFSCRPAEAAGRMGWGFTRGIMDVGPWDAATDPVGIDFASFALTRDNIARTMGRG